MTSHLSSYGYFLLLELRIFFILLELPGDGYSLLCSKKQPPRHNENIYFAWNKIKTQGKFPHCLHGIFPSIDRKKHRTIGGILK
jgi:hypothetical protein